MPRKKQGPPSTERSSKSTKASTRRSTRELNVPEGWTPRIANDDQLADVLERLPTEPGVYVMRDRQGEVIYVGKAAVLRNRVRQYFNGTDTRVFVPLLAKLIGDIETVVVANVKEALLLENNLIKEHRPRFNVKLRDDSNYLVLRLDPKSAWPKLELVRNVGHEGAWYFGPYHSARSARQSLRVINRHFQLRTCSDFALTHRTRPCLQHQIDRC
ncbi:MAG TPA: GIY-YIG nuclease family protein, partial [Nannocystaceae bacterium]|nr:GIY-YIG nuclease family protein [Nannocystaceae bacterium]